jgi:DnaJ like chaperone protein
VVENHPDKVAHLGEEVKAAATKKLQQITEAKERIDKAMGK